MDFNPVEIQKNQTLQIGESLRKFNFDRIRKIKAMDLQADIQLKQYDLINRVMKIRSIVALKELEDILVRIEMDARAIESEEAIEKGEVMSLEEFSRKSNEWLASNTK